MRLKLWQWGKKWSSIRCLLHYRLFPIVLRSSTCFNNSQFLQHVMNDSSTTSQWIPQLTLSPAHMCWMCSKLINDILKWQIFVLLSIQAKEQFSPFCYKDIWESSHVYCCACINTTVISISNHFNFVQQCVQISTRINSSMYICTSVY